MPPEIDRIRPVIQAVRYCDRLSVQWVIRAAILKVILESSADEKAHVAVHSDVPLVEEAMNVAPQQQAVRHVVVPIAGKGFDVGGFEGGQGVFLGHRARPAIGRDYFGTKDPLTKSGLNQCRWPTTVP